MTLFPKGFVPPVTPTSSQAGREFAFSAADFDRVRKLIYEHAGISLSPQKQDMVYSRLARRVRARGLKSFAEYLALLEKGDRPEWESFVNALTTNLTSFFREPHHFPILADYLRRNQGRPVKIWCCASSTGEEPYSIAMTVLDALGGAASQVAIIASDLDTNVLQIADRGEYGEDRISRLTAEQQRKYFVRGSGAKQEVSCVRPELRRLISFSRINLLDRSWPVRGPLDIIFCRNVMIYFDKPTQYQILSRFAPLMRPEGLLFAGHSESFLHASDLFRSQGKTVYEPVRRSG